MYNIYGSLNNFQYEALRSCYRLVEPGRKDVKILYKIGDCNVNLVLNVQKQLKEAEAKAALEEEKRRQQVTENTQT